MTIIGNNTLLGTVAGFNLTTPKKLIGTTQQAVLPANQRLIAVHIGWGPGNGTNSGTIQVALLDEGNVSSNKPVIPGTVFNIPYDSAVLSPINQWISLTGLNVDLSAHEGKTLCPALGSGATASNTGFSVLLGTLSGATRVNSGGGNSVSVPDPFVPGTTSANQAWSLYFETETISAGTSITARTTPIIDTASATLSDGSPVDALRVSYNGLSVDRVPVQTDGAGTEKVYTVASWDRGNLPPLTATDAAEIALVFEGSEYDTATVTLAPPTGSVAYVVDDVGTLNETDPRSIWFYADILPSVGTQLQIFGPATVDANWFVTTTASFTARTWDPTNNTYGPEELFPIATIAASGTLFSDDSNVSGVGSVSVLISASGSFVSSSAQLSGIGSNLELVSGAGSIITSVAQLNGSGNSYQLVSGAGAISVGNSQLNAVGLSYQIVSGAGVISSADAQLSGLGSNYQLIIGAGSLVAGDSQITGVGNSYQGISGAGSLNSDSSELSATISVYQTVTGAGDINSNDSELSGSGSVIGLVSISGNLAANDSVLSGAGGVRISATGNFTSAGSQLDGSARSYQQVTGAGNLASNDSEINGAGSVYQQVTGIGNLSANDSQLNGEGVSIVTVSGIGNFLSQDSHLNGYSFPEPNTPSERTASANNLIPRIANATITGARRASALPR